jgi:hypothetical protein
LKSGSTHYVGFLTGKGNFRYEAATTWPYKGNRVGVEKPSWYPDIREYVVDVWKAVTIEGMEADDGMSIAQGYFSNQGIESVIVTEDKDLLQVPGLHYNPTKSKEVIHKTTEEGDFMLWCQVITGDGVDNIPGVSHAITETTVGKWNIKIKAEVEDTSERRKLYKPHPRQELYGAKTAIKLLEDLEPSLWPSTVLELYIDKYEDSDADEGYGYYRFLETFALVYMLREHEDYQDFTYHTIPASKEVAAMFEVYD